MRLFESKSLRFSPLTCRSDAGEMGEWTRQTQWRQGSLLAGPSAIALGLLSEVESESRVLIAVSHDCDIATDNLRAEPTVEFIVGELIQKVDGSCTRAKNARLLHLEFETAGGKRAFAFSIRDRRDVDKTLLADHAPAAGWKHSSASGLISLRWWLAARYFRSSFPDTFEARLKQSRLDERIDKLISPYGDDVYGIFVLVDDGIGNNRNDDEEHKLTVLVVYDAGSDDARVDEIKAAAAKITAAFTAKFYDGTSKTWKKIELISCDAISDEVFSFADVRTFRQWRLEHRSLEDDAQVLAIESA